MKKIFLIFLITIFYHINAQYDSEHWFSPLHTGIAISSTQGILHLSTGEDEPFQVNVYSDGTLFTSVTIKKSSPAIISIPGDIILTRKDSNLMKPVKMGLHVQGTKRFFANLRFSNEAGSVLINSKGLAALGRNFRSAHVPLTIGHSNISFITSIIATEDNTDVSIDDFNPEVILASPINGGKIQFKLNKGESYIISGSAIHPKNKEGFIGARITSSKDISVTNGAFNGQYFDDATLDPFDSGQIMIDQSVPIERLKDKFIVLRGFGTVWEGEKVMVMATKNNTQIFLNDETTAFKILNEGEYVLIPSNKYKFQRIGMYSMYIYASENIYTYQIATNQDSGMPDGSYKKGSFMMVPPLNCYLPDRVDQISGVLSGSALTKLNILTMKGSEVKVNGKILTSDYGPELVAGTTNWVNFGFLANNNNLTVESNSSITVGIFSERQFGGYFAGFSSVPAIAKTGDCVNGIFLNVDNTYETYQWYKDGIKTPNENNFQINPELYGSGAYVCEVSKGNCEPLKTAEYFYERCLDGIISQQQIGSCNILEIIPAFENSNEPIDFSKFVFTLQPLRGSVTLTNQKIIYTPDPNATESYHDDFSYRIYGFGSDPKIQTFSVKVKIHVLNFPTPTQLDLCTDDPENASFNLSSFDYGSTEGNTVLFYRTSHDAENGTNAISNTTQYNETSEVFAKITSIYGCTQIVEINLRIFEGIPSEHFSFPICLQKNQNEITVKITDYLQNNNENEISFHKTEEDATKNINPISNNQTLQETTTFFVRIKKGQCTQINSVTFSIYKHPEVHVETHGSTINVITTGGTPPFLYALDNGQFSAEPNFYNVNSGFHTISVTPENGCEPQIYNVLLTNLSNVITPNSDNVNDVFSYADFTQKENFKIKIFGRESQIVHLNENNPTITFWDGKYNRKPLPTGTYWYLLEWEESGKKHSLNRWILLKNRD